MMMPYSNSHIRRHELLRLSTLINNNLFPFTYFYVQFKNLFKKNVNINHKMFSLLIYARHEGTDHCRKKNIITRLRGINIFFCNARYFHTRMNHILENILCL